MTPASPATVVGALRADAGGLRADAGAVLARGLQAVRAGSLVRRQGRVCQFHGLVVEAQGPDAVVGELCHIRGRGLAAPVPAEVVGLRGGRVQLMPYGELAGIGLGAEVVASGRSPQLAVGEHLLGRVIDAFGRPLDGRPLAAGPRTLRGLRHAPRNPLVREPIRSVLETGVRAIDGLLTLGRGQRMGVFAGSGVGKSTLLAMVSRRVQADVNVIALIGERGREVRDFIEQGLGPEGLARSVVVVATADQPALVRTRAAQAAATLAEHFREQRHDVLLVMDSITRYAMAQREIGLAIGEPPTARGYTPSVFASLPGLMERCGAVAGQGAVTALYAVLVEGDDLNDPVADHVRAIVDGHIVLSRELAHQGHYPAIDVLASNSRLLHSLATDEERELAQRAVALLACLRQHRDMVDIGAYRAGSHAELDQALRVRPALQAWLRQEIGAQVPRAEALQALRTALQAAH